MQAYAQSAEFVPQKDKNDGSDDESHTAGNGRREGLVKDADAHQDSGEGLHDAEDRGESGADALHGEDKREIGDNGGDDGQQQGEAQFSPGTQGAEDAGGQAVGQGEQAAQGQDVKGHDQTAHVGNAGGEDSGNVDGVAEGGNKQQGHAHGLHAAARAPPRR